MSELFGLLFAEIRKSKGMTQDDVAKRSGLKKSAISKIERGAQTVKLEELYSLSAAVNKTAVCMLCEIDELAYRAKKLPWLEGGQVEVKRLRIRLLARDLAATLN